MPLEGLLGADGVLEGVLPLLTLRELHRCKGVCRAFRAGCGEALRGLPAPLLCGGDVEKGNETAEVWALCAQTMQWTERPPLLEVCYAHSCVRLGDGSVLSLGGMGLEGLLASVEALTAAGTAALPPLSSGWRRCFATAARADDGSVLLLGGCQQVDVDDDDGEGDAPPTAGVERLEPATGLCTPQRPLLGPRAACAMGVLEGGRVILAGGCDAAHPYRQLRTAEAYDPEAGSVALPDMSVPRDACRGCVLPDGRFLVLGGWSGVEYLASCEAYDPQTDQWEAFPPMLQARSNFAVWLLGGCVIVAGGVGADDQPLDSVEVLDLEEGEWCTPGARLLYPICLVGFAPST
jgi:hypothetical protein